MQARSLKIFLGSPYSLILVAVAAAVLAVGIAVKPRKKAQPELSESNLVQIQQLSQRRLAGDLSKYLTEVANNAAPRLLYLKSTPHTAVLWDAGRAVTARQAARPSFYPVDNSQLKAIPVPAGAPIAVLAVPGNPDRKPPSELSLDAGASVLAVARNNDNQIIYSWGVYQGVAPARCNGEPFRQVNTSSPLSNALLGGGLFTVRRELLGVIVQCDGEAVVMENGSVANVLSQAVSIQDRLDEAFGMTVAQGPGAKGAVVLAVWDGSPAGESGIRPGDVIVEANGRQIQSPSDLGPEAEDPSGQHALALLRGKAKLILNLPVEKVPAAAEAAQAAGLVLAPGGGAFPVVVSEVIPKSAAEKAGVRSGDALLSVGETSLKTTEQALRLLRQNSPALMIRIRRDDSEAQVMIPNE